MLRRCVVGLFIVSCATAVVVAGRGDSSVAQTKDVAKNEQPPVDIPLENGNGRQCLKAVNPLPISQVVLFNSGVGYFHRTGKSKAMPASICSSKPATSTT